MNGLVLSCTSFCTNKFISMKTFLRVYHSGLDGEVARVDWVIISADSELANTQEID